MFIAGRKWRAASRRADGAGGGLSREELDSRFEAAVAETRHVRVVKEDVLGEGEGAWDSDPRYPTDTVNCIIWLQLLLSEVYGRGLSAEEKVGVMDKVRYFGGRPAYGLRKCHYLDLWLKLEPAPLRRIPLEEVAGHARGHVEVDKRKFKAFHGYTCELYYEDLSRFEIDYLTAEGFAACVDGLRPGYYVVFPVASRHYLNLYGRNCGPMGLVHSVVLKVARPEDGAAQTTGASGGGHLVYHASTVSGAVMEFALPEYLRAMGDIFSGYTLFEADPDWDSREPSAENAMMRRIRECEASLPRNRVNREL